jgi:hypothetical protein
MCAAASFMPGLLHLLLWTKDRQAGVYLLSMLMAFSDAANALTELALMHAQSIDAYRLLLQWENQFVFTLLVPMVWYVPARLPTARRWLATFITLLGFAAIVMNWRSPYSLVYLSCSSRSATPLASSARITLATVMGSCRRFMASTSSMATSIT